MFVERMEVVEYRQKFEVEQSTFPDSTNTETTRKLVFSFTCVCAKKFISGYLTKKLTDLDDNFGVCCNWPQIENLPRPVRSNQYFPVIWGGGVIFATISTLISKKPVQISKNRDVIDGKFKDLQIWFCTFFSISLTVFEISRKNCFWKSLSGARGRKSVMSWGEIRLKYVLIVNRESPLDGKVGMIFPQN